MADKDIDFEELDRAIGALMEKQAAEEDVINELSEDVGGGNLDEIAADLVAKLEEDNDIVNLAKTGAITDVEVSDIDQEVKDKFVPDTSDATVEVKQRVPVGFEAAKSPSESSSASPRPIKVPIPKDLLGKTVSIGPAKEESFEAKVDPLPKLKAAESKVELAPVKEVPRLADSKSEPELLPEPKVIPSVATASIPQKTHIPHRRGKYIDFMTSTTTPIVAPKRLSPDERRARAARINAQIRQKADKITDVAPKPAVTKRSVGFEMKLPAKDGQPAKTVKGSVQTGRTTVIKPDGEVVTIKEQAVEMVTRPEPKSEPRAELKTEPGLDRKSDIDAKLSVARRALKAAPLQPKELIESNDDDDVQLTPAEPKQPKSSPFIPETKVKKRPLGQPEPLIQSPSVTMHVPDRISTYDAGEQTALYRAELRPVAEEDKKSSIGWTILLILIILIVAGLVYFFWGDVEALLR